MNILLRTIMIGAVALAAGSASAQIVYSEDFASGDPLAADNPFTYFATDAADPVTVTEGVDFTAGIDLALGTDSGRIQVQTGLGSDESTPGFVRLRTDNGTVGATEAAIFVLDASLFSDGDYELSYDFKDGGNLESGDAVKVDIYQAADGFSVSVQNTGSSTIAV